MLLHRVAIRRLRKAIERKPGGGTGTVNATNTIDQSERWLRVDEGSEMTRNLSNSASGSGFEKCTEEGQMADVDCGL